jgi:hypothetical protein
MCGVCGGDNTTCQVITGHFNDVEYGYNHVLLLPAGAANVDIRQHGYQGSNKDDNYLGTKLLIIVSSLRLKTESIKKSFIACCTLHLTVK